MSTQDYQSTIHVPMRQIKKWQGRSRSVGPPPRPQQRNVSTIYASATELAQGIPDTGYMKSTEAASALGDRVRLNYQPNAKLLQKPVEYTSPESVETIQPPGIKEEEDDERMTFTQIQALLKANMPSSRIVKLATQDLTDYPIQDIYLLATYYSIDPNQSFINVCRTIAQRNLEKA